jgi:hypothetical protein
VLEGGVIETEFGSFEGSQAVPASPSGKREAYIRDLFNFDFERCWSGWRRNVFLIVLSWVIIKR